MVSSKDMEVAVSTDMEDVVLEVSSTSIDTVVSPSLACGAGGGGAGGYCGGAGRGGGF